MDNSLFTLDDLLKRLSGLVADAVAALDLSKIKPEDRDMFLQGITGRTVNTFWKTYVEALPGHVQSPLRAAIEQKDEPALQSWYAQYMNLMEDEHARELATEILDRMAKELPKQIRNDFAACRRSRFQWASPAFFCSSAVNRRITSPERAVQILRSFSR